MRASMLARSLCTTAAVLLAVAASVPGTATATLDGASGTTADVPVDVALAPLAAPATDAGPAGTGQAAAEPSMERSVAPPADPATDLPAGTGLELAALDAPAPPRPSEPPSDDAVARLTRALEGLGVLEARFTQTVEDSRGTVLRTATGALWASRPDRFRWEMESPFAEVLVGDGELLYLWDPDLEQVTIRPYDERLRGTPARLLSGSAEDLVDTFEVRMVRGDATRELFELRPRTGDGLFERLDIAFTDGLPRSLVILDSLGQRTGVLLEEVRVGGVVEEGRFAFEIPPGADVLREEAEGSPGDAGH